MWLSVEQGYMLCG